MPCYVTGSREGDNALAWEEAHKRDVQKLTRLLCQALQLLEHTDTAIPKGLTTWWEKHKDQDNETAKPGEGK